LRAFFDGHLAHSCQRRQLEAKGTLDGRSPRFIGVPRAERRQRQHREYIMELLADGRQ
jgi:hypothetical protein